MGGFDFIEDPMLRAACEGDVEQVRLLAKQGRSLTVSHPMVGTPLHFAIINHDEKMIEVLLELGADPNFAPKGCDPPLLTAATHRDLMSVERLLAKGANVNVEKDSMTPIGNAISAGDVEIARRLVEAGADVVRKNRYGVSAMTMLDTTDKNRKKLAAILEPAAAKQSQKANLADAAKLGNRDRVVELLPSSSDQEKAKAAIDATLAGQAEPLLLLLKAGVDPNTLRPKGQYNEPAAPLLHLALAGGHNEAAEVLIENGADINARADSFGGQKATPLMIAAVQCKLGVLKKLVQAGADLELRDAAGETALGWARNFRKKAAIRYFESVRAENPPATPLTLHEAIRDGQTEVARALIEAGADVESTEGDGRTPLVAAVHRQQADIIRFLLEKGADPTRRTSKGASVWDMAAASEVAKDVAPMLLAKVDDPRKLAVSGQPGDEMINFWLAAIMSPAADQLVGLLLKAGLDPNERLPEGSTPFLLACGHAGKQSPVVLEQMLQAGADLTLEVAGPDRRFEKLSAELAGMDPKILNTVMRKFKRPTKALDIAKASNKPGYIFLRDRMGGEVEPYDRADGVLANLKTAALEPTFIELVAEVAKTLGARPAKWKKRAGVTVFFLNLSKRFPNGDELAQLDALQELARSKGAILVRGQQTYDARNLTQILLFPTDQWIAVLRACGVNGDNYGMNTRKIVQWLLEKQDQHPFHVSACGFDFLEIRFIHPIADYQSLWESMLEFCPDMDDGDSANRNDLADFFQSDRRCFFWWD